MLGLPKNKPIKFFSDDYESVCCNAPMIVREMMFWGRNDKKCICEKCHNACDFIRKVKNETG